MVHTAAGVSEEDALVSIQASVVHVPGILPRITSLLSHFHVQLFTYHAAMDGIATVNLRISRSRGADRLEFKLRRVIGVLEVTVGEGLIESNGFETVRCLRALADR